MPFSAWLLRVAHNVAIDHLRRRRAIPCEEVAARDEPGADARTATVDVGEALAALPEDQRTVVVLRHVVGLSPSEIAERLGRSENSIHGLHHRGRGALKAELLERGAGPAVAA